MNSFPVLRGYRMPPEWAPHAATWIAWPHEISDWPGRFHPIPWVYSEIVRLLSAHERVNILVQNRQAEARARACLNRASVNLSNTRFHRIPTDRVWTRDSAPLFVINDAGKRVATHWKFNGWAKYDNHKRDDLVPTRIARALDIPEFPIRWNDREVVLEGGAIDVDGAGLLMATEECLLSNVQARNPGLSRADMERIFGATLGIRNVIWLGRGILGDDTHGHIDDLARFYAPGKVLLAHETDAGSPNYPALEENRERLQGSKLDVTLLPMPAPVIFDGVILPASYANFYVANGLVIVPTFNDPNDRVALGILAECFPGRTIVGVYCRDLVWGFGTLHCATQQEPAPATGN